MNRLNYRLAISSSIWSCIRWQTPTSLIRTSGVPQDKNFSAEATYPLTTSPDPADLFPALFDSLPSTVLEYYPRRNVLARIWQEKRLLPNFGEIYLTSSLKRCRGRLPSKDGRVQAGGQNVQAGGPMIYNPGQVRCLVGTISACREFQVHENSMILQYDGLATLTRGGGV